MIFLILAINLAIFTLHHTKRATKLNIKTLANITIIICTLFFSKNALCKKKDSIPDSLSFYTNKLKLSNEQLMLFPDESYAFLHDSYRFFMRKNDTLKVSQSLINMSEIQRKKGKYSIAFDHLWEALYLAKEIKNNSQQAKIHRKLADLYDIYNMDDSVLHHLQRSLKLSKKLLANQDNKAQHLNASRTSRHRPHRRAVAVDVADAQAK